MDRKDLSLWLLPESQLQDELDEVIRRLAERHAWPLFRAHLTLLSSIGEEEPTAVERCRRLARSISLLRLDVAGLRSEAAYFRALYVALVPSPELEAARALAEGAFAVTASPLVVPHVSLAYGSFYAPEAAAEAGSVLARLPRQFVFTTIALARASSRAPVESWEIVAAFPLPSSCP